MKTDSSVIHPAMSADGLSSSRAGLVDGRERFILLLATSRETNGGIAAVLDTLRRAGLFQRWAIVHLVTHVDGSARQKLRALMLAYGRFLVMLLSRRIALIHAHSASNASFWRKFAFLLPGMVARIPVVFHLHGGGFVDFYNRRYGFFRRAAIRLVLNQASTIVVLTEGWRERVQRMTRNRNIRVIPNAVEPEAFLWSGEDRQNAILFVGRFNAEKGLYELLDAFATVHRRFPGWRLQLAGDGDVGAIRARARALGVLEATEFLGWIGGERKANALRRAAIYVLPSHIECLPVGLLEAMAAGLPVVATRVGGIPEVVRHGCEGLLLEPRDGRALSEALLRLIRDPSRRKAMGSAGRRRVEETFSVARVIPQVEAVYADLGLRPVSRVERRNRTS